MYVSNAYPISSHVPFPNPVFRHSTHTGFHVHAINTTPPAFLNLQIPVVDRQTCDITRRMPELTWAEQEGDNRYLEHHSRTNIVVISKLQTLRLQSVPCEPSTLAELLVSTVQTLSVSMQQLTNQTQASTGV